MSVYAFDSARRELIVVWPSAVGSLAQVVAPLGPECPRRMPVSLCAALSALSAGVVGYVRASGVSG